MKIIKQLNNWGDFMKCEHCGFENSEYAIRCDQCGQPLNIEKNLVLQKNCSFKPRAIDIEKITPDYELIAFNSTKQRVRYFLAFLLGVLFISLIVLFIYLIRSNMTNDINVKINKALDSNEPYVLLIDNDNEYDEKIYKLSKKYEFKYLYIKSNKITLSKRKMIKKKLNIDSLKDTIVYIDKGKVVNKVIFDKEKDIDRYLINNGLIASADGNPEEVMQVVDDAFNAQDSVIMYIANNDNKSNKNHYEQLKKFCSNYELSFVYIEGFKLSDNQKMRLIKRINYSVIHDELLVILDEGNIKNVSEFVGDDEKEYFQLISSYGIIDKSSADKLVNISLKQLGSIAKKDETNVILVSSNNCQYCERTKPILGKISIQNNIKVYNYKYNDKEKKTLEKYLTKRGFKEKVITTPLVIIFKNNKIEDYIIGMSSKTFYEEKFKEYGLIR